VIIDTEVYRPEIEKLHERFGGHTAVWLAEADEILRELQAPAI
jgi:hypothetical protein